MNSNSLSLQGKTILLFGSTGVLGRSHVHQLVSSGADLIIADKPGSNVSELADQYNLPFFYADATNEADIRDLFSDLMKIRKTIQGAIYNVAITSEGLMSSFFDPFPSFAEYPLSLWQKTIDVNLTGAFLFARELSRIFSVQKSGSLIFVSSIYGHLGPDHEIYDGEAFNTFPGYSASKSGIIGLMKWLSTLLAKDNIRINCISPGGIYNHHTDSFKEKYSRRVPMKRMGNSDEISGSIIYLLSDSASYVTGQNLCIDGGLSSW